MGISIYDPQTWDNKTPANVLGGRNRASQAQRDSHGRFMPNDSFLQSMWELDPKHGVPGGQKRGREGLRVRGKFATHLQ